MYDVKAITDAIGHMNHDDLGAVIEAVKLRRTWLGRNTIRKLVARHMAGDDNIDSYSSVLWVQENSLGEINKYVDDIAEAEFAKVAQQG